MAVNIFIRDAEEQAHHRVSLLGDRYKPFRIVLFAHSSFHVMAKEFEENWRFFYEKVRTFSDIVSAIACATKGNDTLLFKLTV
jgi:hypothetical protein